MLVEVEAGRRMGWEFLDIDVELTALLGHRVDLLTPMDISVYIREQIRSEATPVYVC